MLITSNSSYRYPNIREPSIALNSPGKYFGRGRSVTIIELGTCGYPPSSSPSSKTNIKTHRSHPSKSSLPNPHRRYLLSNRRTAWTRVKQWEIKKSLPRRPPDATPPAGLTSVPFIEPRKNSDENVQQQHRQHQPLNIADTTHPQTPHPGSGNVISSGR